MVFKKKPTTPNIQVLLTQENEKRLLLEKKVEQKNHCNTDVLIKLNELLQNMTQLDYVKDMILDVNKQTEMVSNAAANSEEMSATTEDISNYVQDSYKSTNENILSSKESIDKINQSFKVFDETIRKTNNVQENMNQVTSETKKINDMVGIIKNVAEQTNLLALNASIEAARAGEHGKGFAVVANEIKKLAEDTKIQVEYIRKTVGTLVQEIAKTSGELDEVIQSFDHSKSVITDAFESINTMNDSLGGISNTFMQISANIEEQTAASQEMSSNLMVITEKASILKDETIKTGQAFYDISKIIDEIRILGYNQAECIEMPTQIEICISDHLVWRWRVYNMILGFVQLDENAVGTHTICRLGKWIASLDSKDSRVIDFVRELNQPHEQLHQLAKSAISAYNHHDVGLAERELMKMDQVSVKIVELLRKMKSVL